MPAKRRKFESTFPAARIKKIMQLDDDVGRVASSVPIVISRAVEIFLQALLSRASNYAASRSAKTLTVGHIKYCIESEKQWDFLKDLTAKVPDVTACNEKEDSPKRGRKRKNSSSKSPGTTVKRKTKKLEGHDDSDDDDEGDTDSSSPGSSHSLTVMNKQEPSPLAILQKRLSIPSTNSTTTPSTQSPLAMYAATISQPVISSSTKSQSLDVSLSSGTTIKPSPLLAFASSLSQSTTQDNAKGQNLTGLTALSGKANNKEEDDYD